MNTRSGDTRSDIVRALANMPAALFLSWSDTKARYKRSMLGPFWLTLCTDMGRPLVCIEITPSSDFQSKSLEKFPQ